MRIALFGTSADPPTRGHQMILRWLSEHFDLVAVWASDNPFKTQQTPLQHRVAMLDLLIKDINSCCQNIKHYPELSSPRTIYTLDKAKEIWKNADFTLAIGSDLVSGQHQNLSKNPHGLPIMSWYRVEDLLRQVKLLVVPRPDYPVMEADLAQLEHLGVEVAIANLDAPSVSSTAYREKGETTTVTPPIQAYIHQEHLYAWQDAF